MSLTGKQEKFCRCIVSGMTGKDSYKTAYNNKSNDNTAYKESMKLLVKPHIQERIKELNKPLELQAQTKALSAREEQIEYIKKRIELCEQKEDENAIIRYTEMLNKIHSLYGKEEEKENSDNNLTNLDTSVLEKIARIG